MGIAGEARTTKAGGRTIAWTTYGDPGGTPVIYFHGAGGSRLEAGFFHADAEAAGLRVLSIDRPGSGLTDPIPNRTLLASVADVIPVLDTEDVATAPVAGLSAGAMYVWASAHAHPDRITAAVPVSPAINVKPWTDVKVAMPSQMKLMAFLAKNAPGVLKAMQRKQSKMVNRPDGQAGYAKSMRKISPDDATLIEDEQTFLELRATSNEGMRQGNYGGVEFALMAGDWGFDPATQTLPTTLIFGSGDPLAPMIRAWLTHAPKVVGKEMPGGHLLTCLPHARAALIEALSAGAA